MSYLVRDWMRFGAARRRIDSASDPLLDAMRAALADTAARSRSTFRNEYRKVDRILARQNRPTQHIGPFVYDGEIRECKRCGDWFPTDQNQAYCTKACHDEQTRFNAPRQRLRKQAADRGRYKLSKEQ